MAHPVLVRFDELAFIMTATIPSSVTLETRSLLYLILIFCSTMFYPLAVLQQILPGSLILLAQWNPLSRVSDLIKGYLMGTPPVTAQGWIELLTFSGVFILRGAGLYSAAIERSVRTS